MNEIIYELYCSKKKLINHINPNEFEEESYWIKECKETIESIEKDYPQIIGIYERRQEVIKSFTEQQIDHICYQIGCWYMKMKPLLEGTHNLGYMKEVLKTMICGD